MLWPDVDKQWGEIIEILRANLKLNEDICLNRQGNFVPANRPMIEDIICAKSSRDDLLFSYMRAAGIGCELGADREPREITVGTKHKILFGHGGRGEKT
jgi:hypothetical protein